MAMNYYYNYAEIDPATNMCIGVHSGTEDIGEDDYWVRIPDNDPIYLFKYYINGDWYEDAEGTIPFVIC